jgi:hypothetical protein
VTNYACFVVEALIEVQAILSHSSSVFHFLLVPALNTHESLPGFVAACWHRHTKPPSLHMLVLARHMPDSARRRAPTRCHCDRLNNHTNDASSSADMVASKQRWHERAFQRSQALRYLPWELVQPAFMLLSGLVHLLMFIDTVSGCRAQQPFFRGPRIATGWLTGSRNGASSTDGAVSEASQHVATSDGGAAGSCQGSGASAPAGELLRGLLLAMMGCM